MESIYRRVSNVLRVFGTRFSHVMTQNIGSDLDSYTILPVIPPELWLRIFRIVATAPASHKLYEIDYSPFYGLSENDRTVLKDAHWQRTRVKYTLILVCKKWRELALEFLYEDILEGLVVCLKD